jgi:hypothetical protein
MAFSAGTCENRGTPVRERLETATARFVCQSCSDEILAGSAAVLSGGGVEEAVAVRGWLRRVREWRLSRS